MANLQVTVGWDDSQLERGIADTERQLATLERRREARVRIGADTSDLDRRISDVSSRLNNYRNQLNQTTPALDRFNRSAANGSNTLTQFSRIAQDAPFGIMGIGNNLTATAESFAALSMQAGGAGNALRAVGASLLGTGGLLLAISLVTTGLTIMSQQGLTVNDVFAKLSGTFDENRKAMQDLAAETAKDAQAQISSVGAYVAAAQNINLSMQDRLTAVKKLQDEYPAYFGNLTKEQILNGQVANTVREVTAALIAKAKAAALTDRIVKLAEEEEKIQSGINNAILKGSKLYGLNRKESFDLSKVINEQIRLGKSSVDQLLATGEALGFSTTKMAALAVAATNINGLFKDLGSSLRANRAEQDRLTDSINKNVAASIKLEYQAEKVKKVFETPQVTGLDVFIKPTGLDGLVSLSGMLTKVAKDVEGYEGVISTSLKRIPGYFDTSGQEALLRLQKFNADMDKIINKGIAESLSGLAESIGEAFSTGGNVISAVGKSLLSTLGGVLIELGKMAIQTGVGILAISTALKSLNPYVAIAAGAALVALGSAVKGSVKGLGGGGSSSGGAFSTGGGSSSSTGTTYSTGASYTSPAAASTASGSSSFGSGSVVFEISGTSLIGVLNNTLDKNKGLGGSLTI